MADEQRGQPQGVLFHSDNLVIEGATEAEQLK